MPHIDTFEVDPGDVSAVAGRFVTLSEDLRDTAARLIPELTRPGDPVPPYAADPRNLPGRAVTAGHDRAVASAQDLLESLTEGFAVMGTLALGFNADVAAADGDTGRAVSDSDPAGPAA
ncbi:hypothetical protein LX16_1931 [Stackebrandtia albiflava]|uniref:Uncharacterized protein n=1 Tax=Stackebrandtia albiflava TaxID=406432 RepID=A0A562VED2_9ACTN|nr:hypothetical protein [Stackebrandtia albiflava]TWJ16204.1 hypothetical protein LX16_1931 [Stackebrandtia albiflava]